ncbi:hypothetical protein HID58_030214 [Brassica napus]|uniref:Uncharacterized protein n=1 Tax=Brassica napus TaxID=3708 RepID=A0ABQ8CFB9_BRANA|nr:hypothetical protein HID58_030214 [Brassica napus]
MIFSASSLVRPVLTTTGAFSTSSLASFSPSSVNALISFITLIFDAASNFSSFTSNAVFSAALLSAAADAPAGRSPAGTETEEPLSNSSAIRSSFFVLVSGDATAHRWRVAAVKGVARWRKRMDLDKNLEIGDRIFAGEWCLLGLSLSVRVFICSCSFCSSNWNGLLVAH